MQDTLNLGVSVNGKIRAQIEVKTSATQDEILSIAKNSVSKWLEGKNHHKRNFM